MTKKVILLCVAIFFLLGCEKVKLSSNDCDFKLSEQQIEEALDHMRKSNCKVCFVQGPRINGNKGDSEVLSIGIPNYDHNSGIELEMNIIDIKNNVTMVNEVKGVNGNKFCWKDNLIKVHPDKPTIIGLKVILGNVQSENIHLLELIQKNKGMELYSSRAIIITVTD